MRDAVIEAIEKHQGDFGLLLARAKVELLADLFELIQEHNEFLHLVAPAQPEEFAVRHILESLTLLKFLPANAGIVDIGPGAGFPSVPCLIVRDDLRGVLIESKPKKAGFLEKAAAKFGLDKRVRILCSQFEESVKPNLPFVVCRALDKFPKKLPKLIRWSRGSTLLLFSGADLGEELDKLESVYERRLTPRSERRYLYVVKN